MGKQAGDGVVGDRLRREVERERHERALHDELRTHVAADDEFRLKDKREQPGSPILKRQFAR